MATGILGMNARNLKYVRITPMRRKVADDKLVSKQVLAKAGIRIPRLYGVIGSVREFESFDWNALPSSFVVKPNRGFGGGGIMVLRSSQKKSIFIKTPLEDRVWLKPSGAEVTFEEMRSHVLGILDGQFSLQETPDVAYFEKRLIRHKAFATYAPIGISDIRVIVYNRVPVMAMMRIPTEASEGRANVAQGAVAAGIDMASGLTTTSIQKLPRRKAIDAHPDTGVPLYGFAIPFWNDVLRMSIEAADASGIGFLGVDIVIDRHLGPVILEINLRPGLEIQVANQDGLAKRLQRVEGLKISSVEKGIRVAQELFGADTEKRIEEVSGRDVISIVERVTISPMALSQEQKDAAGVSEEASQARTAKKMSVLAKIDTGAYSTSISHGLAKKLGFGNLLKEFDGVNIPQETPAKEADRKAAELLEKWQPVFPELAGVSAVRSSHGLSLRPEVRVLLNISGKRVRVKANIKDRANLRYSMIVGRRDLKRFLVDPSRRLAGQQNPT